MKKKKSLGQNFLRDGGILKKIVDFAHIQKGDTVVEVGPGEGTLTKILLERAGKVIAIEKDERLVSKLTEIFTNEIKQEKLEIINADIIEFRVSSFESRYVLVGNIPYYITGAIFKKFLESENQPKSITFVIQKEVAERIMARDGKESILSISIKAYGEPEYGGTIKAGSFNPKPKVDSAIISIRNISKKKLTPLIPLTLRGKEEGNAEQKSSLRKVWPSKARRPEDFLKRSFSARQNDQNKFEQKFFEVLKKGFAHKRKLLSRNLNVSRSVLDTCGIPEKARAENLKVSDWICLAKNLM